jgi:hypothetical protein
MAVQKAQLFRSNDECLLGSAYTSQATTPTLAIPARANRNACQTLFSTRAQQQKTTQCKVVSDKLTNAVRPPASRGSIRKYSSTSKSVSSVAKLQQVQLCGSYYLSSSSSSMGAGVRRSVRLLGLRCRELLMLLAESSGMMSMSSVPHPPSLPLSHSLSAAHAGRS